MPRNPLPATTGQPLLQPATVAWAADRAAGTSLSWHHDSFKVWSRCRGCRCASHGTCHHVATLQLIVFQRPLTQAGQAWQWQPSSGRTPIERVQ